MASDCVSKKKTETGVVITKDNNDASIIKTFIAKNEHKKDEGYNEKEKNEEDREERKSEGNNIEKEKCYHEEEQNEEGSNSNSSANTTNNYVAPDGGWGWMVTLAGFMVTMLSDGLVNSYGLLIPDLREQFGASVALTSLPPGILVATFLLISPVTGYLVTRWGCRLVGFCGGLLAALGVGVSAYAANIYLFLLGFGLMAGVGVGLIYLPSMTMVNMYFTKKLGMAVGITTSGAGFGLLGLAPLTEMLMEQYGWRGCYLIMAGITLHFCFCASLLRPLPCPAPSSPNSSQTLEGVEEVGEDGWSLVSVEELEDGAEGLLPALATHIEGKRQGVNLQHDNLVHEDGQGADLELRVQIVEKGQVCHLHEKGRQEEERSELRPHRSHQGSVLNSVRSLFLGHQSRSSSHAVCAADNSMVRSRSQGHLESRTSPRTHLPFSVLGTWLVLQVPPSLSRHTLSYHQSADNMAGQRNKYGHQRKKGFAESHMVHSMRNGRRYNSEGGGGGVYGCEHQGGGVAMGGYSLSSVHISNGLEKGMAISSLSSLEYQAPGEESAPPHENETRISLSHPDDLLSSQDEEHHQTLNNRANCAQGCCVSGRGRGVDTVSGCFSRHGVFGLFLMGAFLIQLVNYVPPLLTPSFAYQHDISKDQVATVLSIYGVLNTAGRLLAGVLVYRGARSLHVHNVGTLLSAVACFTLPLCTSFPTIAVSLGLHGFFIGAYAPLQSVILVEYLGLERLTSTFGIMCMVKAFACVMGTPLAGLLFTVTGTYTVPLAGCGAVLIVAAILNQLMDCWPRPVTQYHLT